MNNNPYYSITNSREQGSTLIQRVCYLLCSALLVTAASAWWANSIHLSTALFWPLAIGTFLCIFAMGFARNTPAISLPLLYALSVMEGLLMGPLLGSFARGFPLGATLIAEAATLSAVIVAGVGTYVWISNKDFGGIGRYLVWALIGLIVFGLVSLFVNMGTGAYLLYSLIGVAVFVGFTLYDFSNIKNRFGPDQYVMATVSLYLDFLNLFWFLLRILSIFSGGGGSRRN